MKLIVKERGLHRTWGPKKLEDILLKKHGVERPPARSTIGLILKRHGLSRRHRRKPGIYRTTPTEFTQPERPNHVWTVDFKGWLMACVAIRSLSAIVTAATWSAAMPLPTSSSAPRCVYLRVWHGITAYPRSSAWTTVPPLPRAESRPLEAERVVDRARHRGGVYPSGQTPGQRLA